MNDALTYDALLDAGHYETPCPVCTGDENAQPCSEDCDRLVTLCRNERRIKGLRQAIRISMTLARLYVSESGCIDQRARGCIEQVHAYRASIAALRAA